MLKQLGEHGLTRVLVESGGLLAASLIKENLIDRIVHFTAPSLMGADGKAMIAELGFERLSHIPHFRRTSIRAVGEDIEATYEKITD